MAEARELVARILIDDEPPAMVDQMLDHSLVVGLRRALVERDLVDAPLFLEISKKPNQRLANRAGPDNMNNVLFRHYRSPQKKRADCSRVSGGLFHARRGDAEKTVPPPRLRVSA